MTDAVAVRIGTPIKFLKLPDVCVCNLSADKNIFEPKAKLDDKHRLL